MRIAFPITGKSGDQVYALLKIVVQKAQMEEFVRNGHMRCRRNSNCIELTTPLYLFGDRVSADVTTVKINVELLRQLGTKSMRQVWVELLLRRLLSLEDQSNRITQNILMLGGHRVAVH